MNGFCTALINDSFSFFSFSNKTMTFFSHFEFPKDSNNENNQYKFS